MKLSIDLDGVICDFHRALNIKANDLFGPDRIALDKLPDDWQYTGIFTPNELHEIWGAIHSDPFFWQNVPPIEANCAALRSFLQTQSDHEVYYVTSRAETVGRPVSVQTEQWLMEHNIWPEDNYHAVIPVSEPGLKKFVMHDLSIQFSVDDYGKTIAECSELDNHKAMLLDKPWNRDQDYGTRIFDLEQFFNVVTGKIPTAYYLA